eukprot:TRINITY_DN2272_c0_g1_i2.p1 TRINITY_DN2272_c0_g1~~TRINITY_DN2272_c0_g1_i2.p1  ORF type:complete len:153 (+),score=33.64 TRINITY_DN2272_c0_g1_i2:44-502(+)
MTRRPPRSTQSRSSAASDVYKRQQQSIQSACLPNLGTLTPSSNPFQTHSNINHTYQTRDSTSPSSNTITHLAPWPCPRESAARSNRSPPPPRRYSSSPLKTSPLPWKSSSTARPVSYTHLRAHETVLDLVCRLLLEKKKKNSNPYNTTPIIN